MSYKEDITVEKLKEMLGYDCDTGIFTRLKQDNGRKRFVGKPAGTKTPYGHLVIRIDGGRCMAHRLAWLYVYGVFPKGNIDHINGDPSDNRISNLRDVSQAENLKNQRMRGDNTSGVLGVCWDKSRNKWKAQINVDGKNKGLGRYDSKDDAIKARMEADVKYRYHENHGKR